jgi:phage terminase large subunit GpA-like protein
MVSSRAIPSEPQKRLKAWRLAEAILRPAPKLPPDEWARLHRVYPETSGLPGPRDPGITPYIVPVERAVHAGSHKRVVMVCGAQMGKTDGLLDSMGARLDQRPAPILYVGPIRDFLTDQFEPRLMSLLDEAETLSAKVVRGKRMKKTLKIVAGVPVRLAHAGSSAALKSSPAALALVDEYDEMLANVRRQPVLRHRRHSSDQHGRSQPCSRPGGCGGVSVRVPQ